MNKFSTYKIKALIFLTVLSFSSFCQSKKILLNDTSSVRRDSTVIPKVQKDSLTIDSTKTTSDTLSKDSLSVKDSSDRSKLILTPPLDTAFIWSGTYAGIGIGWTLGNFPIFSWWNGSLPDSLGDFGLNGTPGFPVAESLAGADTVRLRYTTKESPNVYNMTFPLSLSIVNFGDKHRVSGNAMFSYMRKQYQGSISVGPDSLNRKVEFKRSLSLISVFINTDYSYTLPLRYFTIEGVDRSALLLGAGVSPFTRISMKSSISNQTTISDSRVNAIRDSVASRIKELTANGYALSWKAGIISSKHLSGHSALEISMLYGGYWFTGFRSGNHSLQRKEIDSNLDKPDDPISFTSNRFEINVQLIFNNRK